MFAYQHCIVLAYPRLVLWFPKFVLQVKAFLQCLWQWQVAAMDLVRFCLVMLPGQSSTVLPCLLIGVPMIYGLLLDCHLVCVVHVFSNCNWKIVTVWAWLLVSFSGFLFLFTCSSLLISRPRMQYRTVPWWSRTTSCSDSGSHWPCYLGSSTSKAAQYMDISEGGRQEVQRWQVTFL